jgi:hypothetical protein
MNHTEIDQHQVVEHYVAGKLSADDETRFEEHYLTCPACIRAIEDTERLQRGLTAVAAEEVARRTLFAAVAGALRSRGGAFLATALVAVALLPGVLAWQRAATLDSQLDATRQELVAARQDLADERQPRINTPILTLALTRAGEQPLQRISLAPQPEWIVLAVELGDDVEESYTATLTAPGGTTLTAPGGAVVWESAGLRPSYRATLTLSLHSSLLPPGDYVLSVTGQRAWRFPLRVVVVDR